MNLYEVRQEVAELLDQLADLRQRLEQAKRKKDGDPDAIASDIMVLEDTIESMDYDLEGIAEDLTYDIRNQEIQMEAYQKEAEAWKTKAELCKLRVKNEKDLLKYMLESNGVTKMPAGLYTLTVAKNGGKLPILYSTDPEDLPEEFRLEEVTFKPDTEAIRSFLEAGGQSDLFRYGERGTNLRIK